MTAERVWPRSSGAGASRRTRQRSRVSFQGLAPRGFAFLVAPMLRFWCRPLRYTRTDFDALRG